MVSIVGLYWQRKNVLWLGFYICDAGSRYVAFGNSPWGQIVKTLRMKAKTLLLVTWRHAGLGKSMNDSSMSWGVANGDYGSPVLLSLEIWRFSLKLASYDLTTTFRCPWGNAKDMTNSFLPLHISQLKNLLVLLLFSTKISSKNSLLIEK